MKQIGIVILFIIVSVSIFGLITESQNKYIEDWAVENNYEIIDQESQFTIIGSPYYYLNDGQRIYKVVVRKKDTYNREIYWFRTGLYWDIEKEK